MRLVITKYTSVYHIEYRYYHEWALLSNPPAYDPLLSTSDLEGILSKNDLLRLHCTRLLLPLLRSFSVNFNVLITTVVVLYYHILSMKCYIFKKNSKQPSEALKSLTLIFSTDFYLLFEKLNRELSNFLTQRWTNPLIRCRSICSRVLTLFLGFFYSPVRLRPSL